MTNLCLRVWVCFFFLIQYNRKFSMKFIVWPRPIVLGKGIVWLEIKESKSYRMTLIITCQNYKLSGLQQDLFPKFYCFFQTVRNTKKVTVTWHLVPLINHHKTVFIISVTYRILKDLWDQQLQYAFSSNFNKW